MSGGGAIGGAMFERKRLRDLQLSDRRSEYSNTIAAGAQAGTLSDETLKELNDRINRANMAAANIDQTQSDAQAGIVKEQTDAVGSLLAAIGGQDSGAIGQAVARREKERLARQEQMKLLTDRPTTNAARSFSLLTGSVGGSSLIT